MNAKVRALVPLLLDWFTLSARDLPWRRTTDPYAVWVSEIMLQQTQVKTVIPFFERWMRELPDIASLARAPQEKIHKLWEGLGYYTRVRNMQRAAEEIVRSHGGVFPSDFDAVLALPGIGRYTAGALCSIAFGQPTPILDGNVVRVLARLFCIRSNTRENRTNVLLWDLAGRLVAAAGQTLERKSLSPSSALNQSVMELGAMICTPRSPACAICPVRPRCSAHKHRCVEELPDVGERAAVTQRRFVAAVISDRSGRVLVRQRPEGVVNAHMWEFPNVEVATNASDPMIQSAMEGELGCTISTMASLARIKHSITRYRITLDSYSVMLNGQQPRHACGRWLRVEEARKQPFSSAHQRILAGI